MAESNRALKIEIAERLSVKNGLGQERDLVSSVMEISPVSITAVDRDGKIFFANARAEHVLGLTRDAITQRRYNAPAWRITDYEGHPFPDEQLPFRLVVATGEPVFDVRHAIEWPDGRKVLLSINAVPLKDGDGNVDGMVATVEDVTERMQVEEALRIKESAIASSINAIAMADLDGTLIYVNNSFLEMWGCDNQEEVLGEPVLKFWREEQDAMEIVKTLWAKGRWIGELEAKKCDDTYFDVQLSASMVTDGEGRSICMMSSFVDITERKKVELALRESERRFRSIIERSPDGVMLTDEEGVVIEWNPGAERITGLARGQVLGRTLWDIQVQMTLEERRTLQFRERNRAMVQGLLERGQAGWTSGLQDIEIVRSDGTQRTLQTLLFIVQTALGYRVGSILRDITEARQSEEQIRKLSRAIEQSPSTVIITDTQGRIEYANPKFSQVTGYSEEEILGKMPSILKSGEHDAALYKDLWTTVSAGEEWRNEFANRRKSGELYWELASISPVRDAEGLITHYVKVAEDITERKRAEEALRQRTAELEARNEELDAFAHTVAHDLQNPLGVMIGFAETLEEKSSQIPAEQLKPYLQTIAQYGRKMSNIIDELLLLAGVRQMDVKPVPLDMGIIVAEAQKRLADVIVDHNAEIIQPDTWPVALGYGPWVEEVWANYISNAIRHGGNPPRVELGADLLHDSSDVQDNECVGMVRFWVQDDGPGLTPEEQSRLFIPFTQLAQVRVEGHGLGLSIVRRIMEKLGGQAGVESEGVPGKGCVFGFSLPSAMDSDGE